MNNLNVVFLYSFWIFFCWRNSRAALSRSSRAVVMTNPVNGYLIEEKRVYLRHHLVTKASWNISTKKEKRFGVIESHLPSYVDMSRLNTFDAWRNAMRSRGRFFLSPGSLFEVFRDPTFDAVILPTGGLNDDGTPKVFIQAQLDALKYYTNRTQFWIASGGYSPRVSIKLSSSGKLITEARVTGLYLTSKYNITSSSIFLEEMARDTIGNGYFSSHIIKYMNFKNILVVSNRFHLARVRLIFDWLFSLDPSLNKINFYYLEVPDGGLSQELILARQEKEKESMNYFRDVTLKEIHNMKELTEFMYRNHEAYSLGRVNHNYNITLDEAFIRHLY